MITVKKTLKKFILSFILLFGWVAMFTVIKSHTTEWMYYSVFFFAVFLTAIILILFDVYRTKKTYWRFYYKGESCVGSGCIKSYDESFPIVRAEEKLKEEPEYVWIISCIQISKKDYNKIKDERFK